MDMADRFPAAFRPPTASENLLAAGAGSYATPYGTYGQGSRQGAEGSRVWKPQPVVSKSSRFSSPYTEAPQAPRELTRWEATAPYICEFVGTFVLVFTAATCSYTGNKQWTPTAVGCALVVIIYAVGFVSGGYLNPAVTLANFLARKITAFKFACYVIVQIFAGLLAGCFFEVVFLTHSSWVMPVAPFTFAQVAIFEVLFTAMLCFVWLSVSSAVRNNPGNDKNQFFALAIGFVVIAAGYAGGGISGAVLNPSLALGLDLAGWWRGAAAIHWGFAYALAELCGGILAAVLFRICRSEDYVDTRPAHDGQYIDGTSTYVSSQPTRLFSEFLGTFFLVLTFGLNVVLKSTATAWSVSAALVCLVYSLGNVSGGHFNPAVTAAVVLSGRNKCSRQDGIRYALVQLLGGIVASTLISYMHRHGPTAAVRFGMLGMTGLYHWSAVAAVEIFFTFMLTYVVLAVATSDEYTAATRSGQNFYFALAIGFAMCAGNFASGQVSGGYLNPAIALSFAIEGWPGFTSTAQVAGRSGFENFMFHVFSMIYQFFAYYVYWMLYLFFELAGAVLAACAFHLTHPAEYREKLPNYVTYVEHSTREK